MADPARPNMPTDPAPWLLGPDDLSAINHEDALIDRLARGERPDPTDRDPTAALLATCLGVVAGDAR